ncbi:response regulator transcription factor [Acidiferrimicrobium sp. IK]|uniref:response regulator transcription factor n=1 Tax=Acidiferrimicrobium sp. IK TaxID=2871700 RepID=UPI0021CB12B5|nr:response regulator transcription factor [Acidiferrimicrobium sp. IK]MCU4182938.1 response regulator transcription factor [Acidiferrimicrobium sp. IK]
MAAIGEEDNRMRAVPATRSVTRPTVVAIVEDHQLLSQALAAALEMEGCTVVAPPLVDMATLVGSVLAALPDVVLLDLDLGAIGRGLDLVETFVAAEARVLIVSASTDEAMIGECIERGAEGWLRKDVSFDVLFDNAMALARGEAVLQGHERYRLVDLARRVRQEGAARQAPFDALSPRESAVLGSLVEGMTAERIAAASFVSVATIRSQIRSIFVKLGVSSQLEAVAAAARAGWRPPVL